MKTRLIILVLFAAVLTLSFTFAAVNKPSHPQQVTQSATTNSQPVGGLYADEVE